MYLIYFYVDDYKTACNFWLLDTYFTNNYMKIYNKNYEHKFKLLTQYFNNILKQITPEYYIDYYLYNNKTIYNIKNDEIYKDIKFCYKLYKSFLINNFIQCDFDYNRECSWCNFLIYYIFYDGMIVLNKLYKLKCNKNNVYLICQINTKRDLMEFVAYSQKLNIYYIKKYKELLDNAFN